MRSSSRHASGETLSPHTLSRGKRAESSNEHVVAGTAPGSRRARCPPAPRPRRRRRARRKPRGRDPLHAALTPGARVVGVGPLGHRQQAVGEVAGHSDLRQAGGAERVVELLRPESATDRDEAVEHAHAAAEEKRESRAAEQVRHQRPLEVADDQRTPGHARRARPGSRAARPASKWCRNSEAVTTSKLRSPKGRARTSATTRRIVSRCEPEVERLDVEPGRPRRAR